MMGKRIFSGAGLQPVTPLVGNQSCRRLLVPAVVCLLIMPGLLMAAEPKPRSETVCPLNASFDTKAPMGMEVLKLDMDQAMKIALETSLELKIARDGYRKALGDWGQAKAPGGFNIAFSGAGTRIEDPQSSGFTLPLPPAMGGPITMNFGSGRAVYSYGFNITQPVYTGGMLSAYAAQGRLGAEIARENYYTTAENVILNVKQAYYQVLKAKHLSEAAYESLKQVEEHWTMAENHFAAGTAPEYDAIRAWAFRESVCGQFIQASEFYEFTNIVLNNVLKLKINQRAELVDIDVENYNPRPERSVAEYYEIWGQALENRREIKQAELLINLQEKGLKAARSESRAKIYAVGAFGAQQSQEWPPKGDSWMGTVSVSVPIFDHNLARSKVKSALASIDSAKNTLQAARDGITVDYSSSVLALRSSRALVLSSLQARAAAREGLDIAKLRYKEGLAAQFELTDAEAAWSRAETDYFNAVYDYETAYAKFLKAQGKGLDGYSELITAP